MNDLIKKLIAVHDFCDAMVRWRDKLCGPQHYDVLNHLIGFTGLDEDEVVFRCMRKEPFEFGSRGWFYEEWAWSNPCSERETDWHYRVAQCYLFSNARREPWLEMLDDMGPKRGPVLEFGCGVGHNIKPLMDRGVGSVAFYERGHVQYDFVQYRVAQWGLSHGCHSIGQSSVDWHKHIKPGTFKTVVLQDVLEHMPGHEKALGVLVGALRLNGRIYERSPFTPPNNDRVAFKKPFHVVASRPLGKMMKSCGMKLVHKGKEGFNVWQKVR